MKIFIKDDEIRVEYNGKVYDFSRGEFERKPREVVGRIIEILIRKSANALVIK